MDDSRLRLSVPHRKATFKSPGRDGRLSQEARRAQALEEQKRKRLQIIDESRHLDMFADLNLGDSDEEEEEEDGAANADDQIVREGVAQFASMLQSNANAQSSGSLVRQAVAVSAAPIPEGKHKAKGKQKRRKKRKSKWADKCMYAELLEMNEDVISEPLFDGTEVAMTSIEGTQLLSSSTVASQPYSAPLRATRLDDGIPEDLESAWVALSPVPTGKRCLAVTMKGAQWRGVGGAPNTFLRARLTGLPLRPPHGPQQPFPTTLPPNTILDCILDKNWKINGVLHVLDVIRWKGVDLAGCGSGLRFWWRDTRLGELVQMPPPSQSASLTQPPHSPNPSLQESQAQYLFPYPNTIMPVPYITPTTYETLLGDVIPKARRPTGLRVRIPAASGMNVPSPVAEEDSIAETPDADMQVDTPSALFRPHVAHTLLKEVEVEVTPDGILLYLTEATYTPGTGPLSAWVPLKSYTDPTEQGEERKHEMSMQISPIDLFER